MERLANGPILSPSGLLELSTGEVELLTRDQIEIRLLEIDNSSSSSPSDTLQQEPKAILNLICTVTTHRIIFQHKQQPTTRQIHLNDITQAKKSGSGPTFFHPRSKYKLALCTTLPSLLAQNQSLTIDIVFPILDSSLDSRNEMLSQITKSLSRKLWQEQEREQQKLRQKEMERKMTRKVGVNAIVDQTERRHRQAAHITNKAFESNDIDSFMKEASDLVKVIQRYVVTLDKNNTHKNQSGISSTKNPEEEKLNNMLQDMGMTTSLSKDRLGNLYHERLARQIHSFLQTCKKWKECSGMMTLTDFYCLFNRARATNFISPDDLLIALDIANKELKLGISRRTLPNTDVMVIVENALFSEGVMEEKLLHLALEKCDSGVTALDVSHCCNVSVILANEHLKSAERKRMLCRDVTLEGIRFFPNKFNEFSY